MTVATESPRTTLAVLAGGASATLRLLDWDTAFFRARMGVLDEVASGEGDLATLFVEARRVAAGAAFDHFITRCGADDWATIRAAEDAGLRLVDMGVDLALTPSRAMRRKIADVREARGEDLPWAQELAAAAFTHSRFWADPCFTDEQVRSFHREWVKNLWGGLAQRIFVATRPDGTPAGFNACTLREGEGRIVLIAADGSARRSGVGRALVDASLAWFAAEDTRRVYVKTQAGNLPALGLYGRTGFVIDKSELTYSWSRERRGEN